jgi:transcriptional antiterminator RfaH
MAQKVDCAGAGCRPTQVGADNAPAWYAIRTKPNQEPLARLHCENQGFAVYLPLLLTVRRHARRTDEVLRPVFPGYLFLHLATDQRNWPAIAATRGVLGPVCFGEHYVPVPDWVIAALRARENEQGLISPGEFVKEKLVAGCRVEVTLEDNRLIEGVFTSLRGKESVEILLSILQRQVRTITAVDRVRLVE